ncbi:MAG: DUF356 domain-containing protein [Methanobacterium sp.]|nr:DUF356 domain-containing protein [Methanobacterium sp.]
MALILIRSDNQKKILNALADLERHAKLHIKGKPKKLPPKLADEVLERILKQKLRTKSKWAVMVQVEEDITQSIMQVKKIHPPAHLIVLSNEYEDYSHLKITFKNLPPFKGYYSLKSK